MFIEKELLEMLNVIFLLCHDSQTKLGLGQGGEAWLQIRPVFIWPWSLPHQHPRAGAEQERVHSSGAQESDCLSWQCNRS